MSGPSPGAGTAVDALFSPCQRYRYLLTRSRGPARPAIAFVGLIPSVADHSTDEPTIRRCAGFARTWGFGGRRVVNLFTLRATDPTALLDTVAAGGDPVGTRNPVHLRSVAAALTVVLACGATTAAVHGPDYPGQVADGLAAAGAALFDLGPRADGSPRHPRSVPEDPRSVPEDTRLSRWRVART